MGSRFPGETNQEGLLCFCLGAPQSPVELPGAHTQAHLGGAALLELRGCWSLGRWLWASSHSQVRPRSGF